MKIKPIGDLWEKWLKTIGWVFIAIICLAGLVYGIYDIFQSL